MPKVKRPDQPGRLGAMAAVESPDGSQNKTRSRPPRSGLWSRLLALLRRFSRGRRPHAAKSKRRLPSPRSLLLPGVPPKRTLAQWKERRRRTTAEVKAHLAQEQPVQAIKKLTRALLEDPEHPFYHELLKRAVDQRRRRRLRAARRDPWAELPADLRQEALQLEAFSAYVDELEQLFDKAGVPPLSAPPPPHGRKTTGKKGRGREENLRVHRSPRQAPPAEDPDRS